MESNAVLGNRIGGGLGWFMMLKRVGHHLAHAKENNPLDRRRVLPRARALPAERRKLRD